MRCMAVTLPVFFEGEGSAIAAMLGSGVIERVHIRKPGASEDDIRRFVETVPPHLRSRLSLHDCHGLAALYGLGVHLNARNPLPPSGFRGLVSRSCHSLEEASSPAAYRFLSPVFDSISKTGYRAAFDLGSLRGKVDETFVALGGVTPDRLPLLADIGFGGAAFLGYIWQGNPADNLKTIQNICCSL